MDEAIKYHGILRRMGNDEKIGMLESMIQVNGKQSIPILFDLLDDPNYDFRRVAYKELLKFGLSIKDQTGQLLKTGSNDQKYWALQILIAMGDSTSSHVELALNEADDVCKKLAIQALGQFKKESSVRPLIRMFGENNWSVRQYAFEALSQYDESIIPILEEHLTSSSEDYVYWSVKLLGKLGYKAKQSLYDVLKSTDDELKFIIASALGESGDMKILNMLVKCFGEDSYLHSKRSSDSLIQIGNTAIPVIIEALKLQKADKAYWYILTLLKIGPTGIDALHKVLTSKSEHFLWNLQDVFSKIGNDCLPILTRLSEDSAKQIRFFAFQQLSQLTDSAMYPLLIRGLSDQYWVIQKLCSDSLISQDENVVFEMKAAMANVDESSMYWFISVFKHFEKGLQVIVDLLRSENKQYVSLAAAALKGKVTSTMVTDLLHCLKNPHWIVRKEVSDTLISAEEISLEKVVETLSNEDDEIIFWISNVLKNYPKRIYGQLASLLYKKAFPNNLVAKAMGIIGDRYFIVPLQQSLMEQDNLLVLTSLWGLDQIDSAIDSKAIWGLMESLDFRDYPIAVELVRANIDDAKMYVEEGFDKVNPTLIKNCLYLSAELNYLDLIPKIKEVFLGNNSDLTVCAAKSLLYLKHKQAVPWFHSVLEKDFSDSTRLTLLSCLGTLDEDEGLYQVLKIISNCTNETEKLTFTCEVLRLGMQAIPGLIRAFSREDPAVRKVSSEILLEFGGLAIPELKKNLDSNDVNVKFWCSKLLKSTNRS
ncbi:MAG: HEAT repeat domain-containing protein [Candidatus Cloacimonetes bacterium]|nr:HEAT repeat domain-containing protein [Candidatus Cloacimonadota bacterium]